VEWSVCGTMCDVCWPSGGTCAVSGSSRDVRAPEISGGRSLRCQYGIYMCVCIYIFVYIYVYIYVCVCMCVYRYLGWPRTPLGHALRRMYIYMYIRLTPYIHTFYVCMYACIFFYVLYVGPPVTVFGLPVGQQARVNPRTG